MKTLLSLTCLLAVAFYGAQSRPEERAPKLISVTNGGTEGYWGPLEFCPEDTIAVGFALKYHSQQLADDDTAMDGIRLRCYNSTTGNEAFITSTVLEEKGDWGSVYSCTGTKILQKFALRALAANDTSTDKVGAVNMRFMCTGGVIPLTGNGGTKGEWGDYSDSCDTGVCGIQTRVEPFQGLLKDDSGLNDVVYICC